MARTYRRDDKRGKIIADGEDNDHRYRKEGKHTRDRHVREVRHSTRQAIREFDEDITILPDYPHTSGWEDN
jgi:hypothetical protein